MGSCENSNKKFVFSHCQISFRNKTIVYETQLIKKNIFVGLHIATTCLQVSGPLAMSYLQFSLYCPQTLQTFIR